MKQSRYVPFWAVQFFVGALIVLFAVALVAALVGTAVRGPTAFFDELGKTVSRVAPQPAADIRDEAQLKAVIRSMPEGRIRTADRAAVHAAVRAGDELRLARDGSVEIAPTGIPGLVDRLQRALDELKRRFFGP